MPALSNSEASLYGNLGLPYIPSLDGVRGIAALLVVFFHFGIVLGFYPLPGYLGVMIFFVLSGFLITWLLLKENEKTGDISLKQFYIRRSLRIFPAFYAFWIFTVALRLVSHSPVPWANAFASFFYVNNYYVALTGPGHTFMGQTWSLGIEEQFYLLWPFLFWRGKRDLRKLSMFLIVVIVAVWIYRAILRFTLGVSTEYLQYALDCRLDALFAGCLLAILLKQQRLGGLVRIACSSTLNPLILIAGLALSVHFTNSLGFNYSQILGFPVEELCVAALLVQLIAFGHRAPWRALNCGLARFLGRISYSLYLYHALSFRYLPKPLRGWVEGSSVVVQVLVGLAISMGFAVVSYYGIERFFLRVKKKHEGLNIQSEGPVPSRPVEVAACPSVLSS